MQRLSDIPEACLARLLLGLLTIFAASSVAHARDATDTPTLVLSNATLVDGTGAEPRPQVTLVIEDGMIVDIVEGEAPEAPQGATAVDLSGSFVLPGLVESHVHLSNMEDPRGFLEGLFESGVTTARDMGGDARTLAVLARDAKIGAIRSPDVYYSATFFGPPFLQDPRSRRMALGVEPGTAPWGRVVTAESDLAQLVAEARGTGATGLKLYSALEPRLVGEIVDEAHLQGLKVWSHATIFPSKPSDAVAAGVDVLSHASGLYAEARPDVPSSYTEGITRWMPKQDFAAVDPSGPRFEDLFARMAREGAILEPTIAVFRRERKRPTPEDYNRHLSEAARRIDVGALGEWACAATRAAHEAGVTIAAGTDSTPRRSIPISQEMEALVECGLSPLDAIRAATLDGARALGIEATHGSVEVGKVADLVILAADPVQDVGNVSRVAAVVKAGRLYELGLGASPAPP